MKVSAISCLAAQVASAGLLVLFLGDAVSAAPAASKPKGGSVKPAGLHAVVVPDRVPRADIEKLMKADFISGIACREKWENLQPGKNVYDFKRMDDIIALAEKYKKTVQLILVPGFFTPAWVLDEIESCEDIESKKTPPEACGKALFAAPYGPESKKGSGERFLPLPWDGTYKAAWKKFLGEVAKRYNADGTVVSVAIAGPTSVSAEMSLPAETKKEVAKWKNLLSMRFGKKSEKSASNQAIIDEWKEMIDAYDGLFAGKTVVLTRGAGLIPFAKKKAKDTDQAKTLDPKNPQDAKEIISEYFVKAAYKNNLKAQQTSGLKACRNFKGGIVRIKELTQEGILGGAQFNSSVFANSEIMGCLDDDFCSREDKSKMCGKAKHACCSLTPGQALKNLLGVAFADTVQGKDFGVAAGSARLSYLQVYSTDVLESGDDKAFRDLLRAADDALKKGAPAKPSLQPSAGGIYSLTGWNELPDEKVWNLPFIDGVSVRVYWSRLNPKDGKYEWSLLDTVFEKAEAAHKKVRIAVAPGFYSPDWVLADPGIEKAAFIVPEGALGGQSGKLPLPWDEKYLSRWFAFVGELGKRYRERESFAFISVTGPNAHNGEVSLPRTPKDQKTWLGLAGNDKEELRKRLVASWNEAIDRFCEHFAGRKITLALILKSYPLNDAALEEGYKQGLIDHGVETCSGTFGIQTNGLDARPLYPAGKGPLPHWLKIKQYAGVILTGFQTRAPANLYPGKKLDEAKKKKLFEQAVLVNGASFKAGFIEIYQSDALDPALAGSIGKARKALSAP